MSIVNSHFYYICSILLNKLLVLLTYMITTGHSLYMLKNMI